VISAVCAAKDNLCVSAQPEPAESLPIVQRSRQ
jgi:hypothetical protein